MIVGKTTLVTSHDVNDAIYYSAATVRGGDGIAKSRFNGRGQYRNYISLFGPIQNVLPFEGT
jgi:hypothetical protein